MQKVSCCAVAIDEAEKLLKLHLIAIWKMENKMENQLQYVRLKVYNGKIKDGIMYNRRTQTE